MAKEETRPGRSTSPADLEFFNTLEEMRRDWMARATAEIELSLKLSKKLTDAHSVPDAVTAYQEWLNEEMGARAEDARLLMSSGQKFMDTTSRFLSSGWTNVGVTTYRCGADTGWRAQRAMATIARGVIIVSIEKLNSARSRGADGQLTLMR